MKNKISCSNCGHENAFYRLNCTQCNSILRSRVVNIDLWKTFWQIIESPQTAFKNIVHSENKNYVLSLAVLLSIKIFLLLLFLSSLTGLNTNIADYLKWNLLISIGCTVVLINLFSFFLSRINNLLHLETRFKDNVSILVYALLPEVFGLLILVPVEYALFGKYWFTFNPSPFLIKALEAYVLVSLEGLLILWSIFLSVTAMYIQSKNIGYSISLGTAFVIVILVLPILLPFLPF